MNINVKREINRVIWTIIGSTVMCIGLGYFLKPLTLYASGLTGVLQVMSNALYVFAKVDWRSSLGILVFVGNLPLLILAFKTLSKKYAIYSLLSVVVQTVALEVIARTLPNGGVGLEPIFGLDYLACALVGGALMGIGIGICLKVGSSTAGFDILFQYLALKTKYTFDALNLYINCIIVAFAVLIALEDPLLSNNAAMKIGIFTFVRVITTVITISYTNRSYNVVAVRVYSQDKHEELTDALIKGLGRGVTVHDKVGGYTHQPGKMLFIIMNRYELKACYQIVEQIEPRAFIVVCKVEEVVGNFTKKVMN